MITTARVDDPRRRSAEDPELVEPLSKTLLSEPEASSRSLKRNDVVSPRFVDLKRGLT